MARQNRYTIQCYKFNCFVISSNIPTDHYMCFSIHCIVATLLVRHRHMYINNLMASDSYQCIHLRWMQLMMNDEHNAMWCSTNLLTAWWAEHQFPPTVLLRPLSIAMLHWWIINGEYVICIGIIIDRIISQYVNVWWMTLLQQNASNFSR